MYNYNVSKQNSKHKGSLHHRLYLYSLHPIKTNNQFRVLTHYKLAKRFAPEDLLVLFHLFFESLPALPSVFFSALAQPPVASCPSLNLRNEEDGF